MWNFYYLFISILSLCTGIYALCVERAIINVVCNSGIFCCLLLSIPLEK